MYIILFYKKKILKLKLRNNKKGRFEIGGSFFLFFLNSVRILPLPAMPSALQTFHAYAPSKPFMLMPVAVLLSAAYCMQCYHVTLPSTKPPPTIKISPS